MITINETHEYTFDGKMIPGVTEIIRETIGGQWSVSDWYLTRGKAIHKCAEFIVKGYKFIFDERLSGYVTAIKKFFAEVKPKPIFDGGEIVVYSQLYKFAGTIDLPCIIGNKGVVVDYKHSIDHERLKLQCGGYSQALLEDKGFDLKYGAGVEIREDGTYSMTELFPLQTPRREFIAIRTAYGIKERMKLLSYQRKD